jgi:hypothetical protein
MAKTTIAVQVAPGAYAGVLATLSWTKLIGSTGANGNQTPITGAEVFIFHNNATGSRPLLIESVDDQLGRQEDLSVTLTSGTYRFVGPMKIEGWRQSDGNLYYESTATQIRVAVVKVPGL